MSEQDAALDLSEAEAALERGDYGQGLELLLPLAEQHPLNSPEGPGLRLLMITAWMGQGQDDKAIATCRLLSRCRDPKLRQQAKQLLGVLEAPSLDRPERWSMRMPQLELNGSDSGQTSTMRRRSRRPEPPPPPPTGPTRSPAAGFAVLPIYMLKRGDPVLSRARALEILRGNTGFIAFFVEKFWTIHSLTALSNLALFIGILETWSTSTASVKAALIALFTASTILSAIAVSAPSFVVVRKMREQRDRAEQNVEPKN